MKKIILVFIPTLFCFITVSAQVEKKAIYPELSIGRHLFNYNTNSYQSGISVGLNSHSTLGVFYSHTKYSSYPSPLESVSTVNRYGVSYTYYSFLKNSQKWGWTLNGTASAGDVHIYYKPAGTAATFRNISDFDISVTPGIFFKPSSRVMLTGNLGGFSIYNSRFPVGSSRGTFGGELNLGIRIKLFGKKN